MERDKKLGISEGAMRKIAADWVADDAPECPECKVTLLKRVLPGFLYCDNCCWDSEQE